MEIGAQGLYHRQDQKGDQQARITLRQNLLPLVAQISGPNYWKLLGRICEPINHCREELPIFKTQCWWIQVRSLEDSEQSTGQSKEKRTHETSFGGLHRLLEEILLDLIEIIASSRKQWLVILWELCLQVQNLVREKTSQKNTLHGGGSEVQPLDQFAPGTRKEDQHQLQ